MLTSSAGIEGSVSFESTADGVRVLAEVRGLSSGSHGFHIHETGDCSAADFSSAGGHFNPHGHPHGGPSDPAHHVGDLGNLNADETGAAGLEAEPELNLDGQSPDSVIGKAVIIHGGTDDLKSQPSGAAGPRVACGVIERVD
ncbi:MAG: superoxide dismutase family protein [Nannocystaceae bacterium]|nr:superoxide dismutase family protein [Nannocystaceae bacterium]